jgi:hypothetical protein
MVLFTHLDPVSANFAVFSRTQTIFTNEENSANESVDDLVLCGAHDFHCGCYTGYDHNKIAGAIDYDGSETSDTGRNIFQSSLCGGQPGAILLTKRNDGRENRDVGVQWMPGMNVRHCYEDRSIVGGCPAFMGDVAAASRLDRQSSLLCL